MSTKLRQIIESIVDRKVRSLNENNKIIYSAIARRDMSDADIDFMNRIIKIINGAKSNSTTIEDINVSYDSHWNIVIAVVTLSDPNYTWNKRGTLEPYGDDQLGDLSDEIHKEMTSLGLLRQLNHNVLQPDLLKPQLHIEFRLDKSYQPETVRSYDYLLPKYNKLIKSLRSNQIDCSVYLIVNNDDGVAKINIDLYRNYSDEKSDQTQQAALDAGLKKNEYSIQGSSMGSGGLKNDQGVEEYEVI